MHESSEWPLRMRQLLAHWLPVVAWMAVIFYFSSQSSLPSSPNPLIEVVTKKAAHATEYAILCLLLLRAFVKRWPLDVRRAAIVALLIVVIFAASDEFHQSFTPHRTPSPIDVLIDSSGAALATFVALRVRSRV